MLFLTLDHIINEDGVVPVDGNITWLTLISEQAWNDMLRRKEAGIINEPVWAWTDTHTEIQTD